MGNSIASLRFLGSNDWRDFVEQHSIVEQVLRQDPAGVYAAMDFATRDRYRHAVEAIARRSTGSEQDIADKAILLAKALGSVSQPGLSANVEEHRNGQLDDRRTHVGYFLIDEGRPTLERSAAMRTSLRIAAAKLGRRYPLFFYLMGVLAIAAAAVAACWRGVEPTPLCLLAIPILMCAAHLGISSRELAGDRAGRAEAAPPARFLHRDSTRTPDDGRRPDDALQRRGRAGPSGGSRSSLPGESRRQRPFRAADRP